MLEVFQRKGWDRVGTCTWTSQALWCNPPGRAGTSGKPFGYLWYWRPVPRLQKRMYLYGQAYWSRCWHCHTPLLWFMQINLWLYWQCDVRTSERAFEGIPGRNQTVQGDYLVRLSWTASDYRQGNGISLLPLGKEQEVAFYEMIIQNILTVK